jgi:drug/metabolite transporter (DMT)-like permease
MQNKNTIALLALGFTTLVWGITPVFVRSLSVQLGPYEALIIRLVLTGIVFASVLSVSTGFKVDRSDWPKLVFLSVIGMLGYYAFSVFGFAYAPAGLGTLIYSTQPLLIAIFASFAGTEKLTRFVVFGLVVSFAGSILLVWGEDMSSGSNLALGCFLIFCSGLGWSAFVVHCKPLIQRYGALKITGLSNVIIMFPALPFVSTDTFNTLRNMDQNAIFSLAFLILVGSTISVFTWNYASGILRPLLLASSLYILPILALAAGWAILHEPITANTILAATVILAGVAIAQIKPKPKAA